MPWHFELVFARHVQLGVSCFLLATIVAIGWIRRIRLGRLGACCGLIGCALVAAAAGEPQLFLSRAGRITVMIDLSPSTRGATFRDRGAMLDRVHQLLGNLPYELLAFSDHNQSLPTAMSDLPSDQTVFAPPSSDAILLFSDGQFDLPTDAPPTYPVIDPALDHPADAAVTELVPVDHQVLAGVRSDGSTRTLSWSNAKPDGPQPGVNDFTELATPIAMSPVTASLSPGDRWPENDSLTLIPVPVAQNQKWWIGIGAPPGYLAFSPANFPDDPDDFLQPSVIVLSNVPADALSSIQQQHLLQYVGDLGGSLVLVGGDHAFAAGHYQGTPLDELSPLSSSPPRPSMQWILLIDSSGSMAGPMTGPMADSGSTPSPWQTEVTAITGLLPTLPPEDPLSIGSFSASLHWWSTGKSAAQTQRLLLPPADAGPSGPTNLAAALSNIALADEGSMPAQLLLMTDADADLPDPTALASALEGKKIHLHLLAIGNGSALSALRAIAAQTHGTVVQELDPARWVSAATLLLRSTLPDRYEHRPIQISPPPRIISAWNQTWLKHSATAIEKSTESPVSIVSAQWQLGLGKVIAIAYPAATARVQSLADRIATPPEDPRFTVAVSAGAELKVQVNAIDHDQFLNNQTLQLQLQDPQADGQPPTIFTIPQTAPGQYQLTLPAPRSTRWLTVGNSTQILKRVAIAGRYPKEFDAIGNNLPNLESLATRTGGAVIAAGPVQPIDFHWPEKQFPLFSEMAVAGIAMIGMALSLNRREQG